MVICGLARAKIERAFEAVRQAPRHRIHTFLATSDIHLKHKLKITREQCVEQVRSVPRLHEPLWLLVHEGHAPQKEKGTHGRGLRSHLADVVTNW